MKFSDWIKARLEALHALVTPDDPSTDGEQPDPLVMKITSSPANVAMVRKAVERFCDSAGLDAPARDEVGLVVNEAIANVIRHAYAGATDKPIEVHGKKVSGGIKISIRDWGSGVDPSTCACAAKDPLVPGGLGLMCISRLMDDVKYEPQADGVLLTMTRTSNGSKCTAD